MSYGEARKRFEKKIKKFACELWRDAGRIRKAVVVYTDTAGFRVQDLGFRFLFVDLQRTHSTCKENTFCIYR